MELDDSFPNMSIMLTVLMAKSSPFTLSTLRQD